jgi:hypothetical protein
MQFKEGEISEGNAAPTTQPQSTINLTIDILSANPFLQAITKDSQNSSMFNNSWN